MASEPRVINPFYILLMIAGTIFGLTACAYFVMALRMKTPDVSDLDPNAPLTLVTFLDRHGLVLLIAEIVILALCTLAAISTDDFWTRRAKERSHDDSAKKP